MCSLVPPIYTKTLSPRNVEGRSNKNLNVPFTESYTSPTDTSDLNPTGNSEFAF